MRIEDVDDLGKELAPVVSADEVVQKEEPTTVEVTHKQQEISRKIAVIDNEIETLGATVINEDEFYERLDEFLTDEDRYLQEEDNKAYLKIVDKKKKEFLESNSNKDAIAKKQEEKNNLQYESDIEDGIKDVTKIYKNYKHADSAEFFASKLSKEQQEEIYKKSKTFGDVFKFTHEKYLESKGEQIVKTTPAPNTINLSNVTQTSLKNKDIIAIDSEDEKYTKALGL